MAEPMLQIENLCAWYGPSQALHGANLHVNEGEVVALLGRNGAGKTTLLRSVMGLVDRREGAIRSTARDMHDGRGERQQIVPAVAVEIRRFERAERPRQRERHARGERPRAEAAIELQCGAGAGVPRHHVGDGVGIEAPDRQMGQARRQPGVVDRPIGDPALQDRRPLRVGMIDWGAVGARGASEEAERHHQGFAASSD